MGGASRSRTDNFEGSCLGHAGMAYEIIRLFEITDVRSKRIFAMASHESGIVTFGKNLEDAFDVLMCARELPQPCDAGRQYAGYSGQNARTPRQPAE